MTETIDFGVVGNLKVSVLKDENTGEINLVITPQTNYGIVPMLDIDEIKLLSSKLLEIIDSTTNAKPELYMCDNLMKFIEKEKVKENRTVAEWVVQWILEEIISGKCKITGSATDHKEAKMYVEFTFYRGEHDGQDS